MAGAPRASAILALDSRAAGVVQLFAGFLTFSVHVLDTAVSSGTITISKTTCPPPVTVTCPPPSTIICGGVGEKGFSAKLHQKVR